ncbi:hypothetical protein QZJ86_12110 [Methylomonas montana]|uniref:capsid staple protein n=1 Tax=Methylomonas montana TaxID=3058963 RepID=UPI002658E3D0|nr:hypothetical protein [Methylomonas montana]WKJ88766.1 hypothetical protein QZJ86_12110 [Methylomonas montana]
MKTTDSGVEAISDNPYGYGLSIYLNDDQCEALGIKQPLRAGTQVKITALAFVQSATESVEDDGDDTGNDISLSLQITDMELSGTSNAAEHAGKLYGDA